ncbi:hypothetical protein DUNSADRAFT_1065 [Dunaliella salina]|uniref:Encoded protein n=1 Tax=Dunaliella salina TaxID=3046 RepID=A0ABQ7FY26_DUNSA|nr:hypothetical protein DUNSADRAFT_1065 [Dunaliella salina]|eukprot:KAF5827251.1 hypothetical protein DUNSADRAFT_1065 [Dunaliella salina]
MGRMDLQWVTWLFRRGTTSFWCRVMVGYIKQGSSHILMWTVCCISAHAGYWDGGALELCFHVKCCQVSKSFQSLQQIVDLLHVHSGFCWALQIPTSPFYL